MTNFIWPQTASNPRVAPIHRNLIQSAHRDQPNPTKLAQQIGKARSNQGELGPADV